MKANFLKITLSLALIVSALLLLERCGSEQQDKPDVKEVKEKERPQVDVPSFDADSAYHFVQKQVDFGPRVPGADAHVECGDYLVAKLKAYGATVIEQEDEVEAYDGTKLPMRNIIGQFQPEKKERILLFAHWDTRPFADKDDERIAVPIDGANDGGSGVGVLLEVARHLSQSPTALGIDIIFFDTEDYGAPEGGMVDGDYRDWCLGSQYWGLNPHVTGYTAKYGILLDMVGAPDAVFPREGTSMYFASRIVRKVWNAASDMGYGDMFVNNVSGETIDDHLFVNQLLKIPSIAIVHYITDENDPGYGDFHHTHDDNMDGISKATLGKVGKVLMDVIYHEE